MGIPFRVREWFRHALGFRGAGVAGSDWFESRLFCCLPREFEIQVGELIKEVRGIDMDRDRYFSVPYARVLAIEQGEVIGVVELFRRQIVFDGETLSLGGVGGVVTAEKRRRRGVATALLKMGMEDFRAQNFDLAFLCADVNNPAMVKLYGRVGFVPLGKPYVYRGESGAEYVEHNGMIAPVNSNDKFRHILRGKGILDIGVGAW